jgi:type II secretory pathway pseudopilin PulG
MLKRQSLPLTLLKLTKQSEQGLSFTEVLVSIMISSIVLALLAPLFLISAAYRLNSLRAEQASAVAQSEIDRVQTLMARGVDKNETLGKLPPSTKEKLATLTPPKATVGDRNKLTDISKALELDYDDDGKPDFLVQLFRDPGVDFDSGASKDQVAFFKMGVRVYSIAAKDNLANLDTSGELASTLFTNFQDQIEKPLATINTEIIRGDSKLSLLKYKEYLESQ